MVKKSKNRYFDYSLKFIIYFLLVFGLIILYSTSSYNGRLKLGDSAYYLKKQMISTFLGVLVMEFVSRVDYHNWRPFYRLAFWGAIVMTLLVRFTPLGVTANGARRWLGYKNYSFQPAEFAKIALILYIAVFICKNKRFAKNPKLLLSMWGATILMALCVLIFTDNLSTAIIIGGIGVIMTFVAYSDYKPFAKVGLVFAIVVAFFLVIVFTFIKSSDNFRIQRLLAWRSPEEYTSNIAYQTLQALYAIGSGGLFGKGLGNSIQKLGFVPEAQNDMIFSIICEELGLFGAISIMIIFGLMLWRFMLIANHAPDLFGSLIVTGIMAHIALQVVLNIAVVTNVIPNTGITLPFISYGGTSVVFLLAEMGLALNISSQMEV